MLGAMKNRRRVLAMLVFAGCLYVGSYAALLSPQVSGEGRLGVIYYWRVPAYRWNGTAVNRLFQPLTVVDKIVRPTYWRGTELMPATPDLDLPIRQTGGK